VNITDNKISGKWQLLFIKEKDRILDKNEGYDTLIISDSLKNLSRFKLPNYHGKQQILLVREKEVICRTGYYKKKKHYKYHHEVYIDGKNSGSL
jgi:hypothetical protein